MCENQNIAKKMDIVDCDDDKRQKKFFYHRSLSTRSCGRRTMPEYQLIACLLGRVSLLNVRESLKWIQNNVEIDL